MGFEFSGWRLTLICTVRGEGFLMAAHVFLDAFNTWLEERLLRVALVEKNETSFIDEICIIVPIMVFKIK